MIKRKRGSASLAKTTRPKLSGVFPRTRLFRVLDRNRKQSLLWVTGPPGSGKTTLVASYLDSRKLPGLWYQVDEGDADVASFFHYMRLAAGQAAPRYRKPLPLLTPEYLPGLSAFTRRYFQDLYTRLGLPFVMVFDNYQEVPTDSPFHEVIRDGLTQVPEGGNVIVISRSDPPATLARLRASHAMLVIDWETMRLTLEEAHGIARLRGRGGRLRNTVELLHKRTDGWAAGLILLLEWAKAGDTATAPLDIHTPESVFDYFASEIFKKVDRRTQEFLLKTAFLGSMTARMAGQLAGPGRAERILSDLTRGNYFTDVRSLPQPVYVYHPLFREFLIARARETFSPADLALVQRSAAAILQASGEIEDAVHLLREANDWDGLVRLIFDQAPSLLAQGRMQTLENWLEHLPQTMVDQTPWLQYWLGTCQLPFNLTRSRQHFEQAFQGFRTQRDPTGTFLSWFGIVETILAEWGDYTRLDRWTEILEVLVREHPSFPSPEIESRVTSTMFCALMLRQPHHPDIGAWAERAYSLSLNSADVHLRMLIGFHLTLYHLWLGNLAKAEGVVALHRELAQTRGVHQHTRLMWAVADAAYDWHMASHEACLKTVSEGLERAHTTGIRIWDYQLLSQGVYGALAAGDLTAAKGFLQKMASVLEGSRRLDACQYHYLSAWHAMLRRDLPRALLHVETALRLAIECSTPFPQALNHLAMAQVLLERGDHEQAASHLAKGRRIGRHMKSAMTEYMSLLAEAQFAMNEANEALSLKALREALALGNARGFVNTPWWRPGVVARLCVKALSAGIEVAYVQNLVRTRGLAPDTPPHEVEHWPWALRVYTLGEFRLEKDGRRIWPSGKVQQKPLAMLKVLIAFGGRNVHEDQLADALWPEASGDAAHQAFATTLHRLRHLISHEKALSLREGRLSLDPRLCWVDTWAFDRLIEQAGATSKAGRPDQFAALVEKAIKLYQGPFLDGDTRAPWAVSMRERLSRKYLRQIGRLGEHWEQAGKWAAAVECYERGLEVDDLAEEFYQRLIACYRRLGRRAEALAVYDRCKKNLSALLGVTPSPETESLRQALRRS